MLKNKKILKIFIVIIVVGLAVFFGLRKLNSKSQAQKANINPKKTKTSVVKKGSLKKYLTLAGKVDAETIATLQFQTSGLLTWIGVKEGDMVKKGQAIASLDKEELQKNFQKYMNDYMTNRWNFEDTQDQYKQTKDKFLVTPEIQRILDKKQFSLNNAVLDVEIKNLAIKYATLYSPISGIVTEIEEPVAGVNVTPSGSNFTVIDPSSVYFKSEVDEEDVINVFEGQEAIIIFDSYPDEEVSTKIKSIAFTPVSGQTSTVYNIKLNLSTDNKQLKYRLGMNGDAKILIAKSDDCLYIPTEALREENGEKFVYVMNKETNAPQKKTVLTGIETDDDVEITEGLSENEKVFINGN